MLPLDGLPGSPRPTSGSLGCQGPRPSRKIRAPRRLSHPSPLFSYIAVQRPASLSRDGTGAVGGSPGSPASGLAWHGFCRCLPQDVARGQRKREGLAGPSQLLGGVMRRLLWDKAVSRGCCSAHLCGSSVWAGVGASTQHPRPSLSPRLSGLVSSRRLSGWAPSPSPFINEEAEVQEG